jgi:CRISPR-associated endonuclease/helicase Cas3
MPPYVSAYWGKARPMSASVPSWHPLAYHCLDVAAAMDALLTTRPAWLVAIASSSGLSPSETRLRLVLAAALHDLGKFAENFQNKAPGVHHALQSNPFAANDRRGHGEIGAGLWSLQESAPGFLAIKAWVGAAFAHHGAPADPPDSIVNAMSPQAQTDAMAFYKSMLELIGEPSDERLAKSAKAETWRVAGLIILADWIGSNQQWFPYAEPRHGLADYWAIARERASHALAEAQLAESPSANHFNLRALLSAESIPSPLQAWAEAQAPSSGPNLYIIEDLTGSGKTEAALILAHRLMRAGAAEGIYWALPSMATANGLYSRLEHTYRRLFADNSAPSIVLAHGARDLHDGFQASIGRDQISTYGAGTESQDISAEAACAAFIAEDRKKTFLAQVGVGTLDQALMGVLPVRHQALRLAALSRRVLVIDEAHAFDDYMTVEMERLLSFQAALGGSAIILSATLTQAQREKFARAYANGRGPLAETAFPLATHVTRVETVETPLISQRGSRRDLSARLFDTPEAVMEALLSAARNGACGVYVRNTVKDALAAVDYLRERAEAGVQVHLFHARYAIGDRIARETEVLARFGKTSTPEQRRGHILVATQVVEQSLDLDFDHMATDLCPMDLLIQRAGRLHRHDRGSERGMPQLWVVGPEATDTVASDWFSAGFPIAQYVYPDAGQLWRTMRVLTQAGGLPLLSGSPRDLIEPVFGQDPIDFPASLDAIASKAQAKRQAERAIGHLNVLKTDRFDAQGGAWGSDTRTPTRLGDETIVLRLARWDGATLWPWCDGETEHRAWRLSELSVRAGAVAETIAPTPEAATAIKFTQDGWPTRYEPPMVLALIPGQIAGVWEGAWCDRQGRSRSVFYSSTGGLAI